MADSKVSQLISEIDIQIWVEKNCMLISGYRLFIINTF